MNRRQGRLAAAAVLLLASGPSAQQAPPSLLVVPWSSAAAPNMAAELAVEFTTALDSLDLFDRADWDGLFNSYSTRPRQGFPLPPSCLVGRQMAAMEGIDYVLCLELHPTADGVSTQMDLYEMESGTMTKLGPLVAQRAEALVAEALSRLEGWAGREGSLHHLTSTTAMTRFVRWPGLTTP